MFENIFEKIDGNWTELLFHTIKYINLPSLNISVDGNIKNEALEILSESVMHTNISILRVDLHSDNIVGSDALIDQVVGSIINTSAYVEIKIDSKNINNMQQRIDNALTLKKEIYKIKESKKPLKINLSNKNVGHREIKALIDAIEKTSVSELIIDLSKNNIGDSEIEMLAKMVRKLNLSKFSINLNNNKIKSNKALKLLADAIIEVSIKHISIDIDVESNILVLKEGKKYINNALSFNKKILEIRNSQQQNINFKDLEIKDKEIDAIIKAVKESSRPKMRIDLKSGKTGDCVAQNIVIEKENGINKWYPIYADNSNSILCPDLLKSYLMGKSNDQHVEHEQIFNKKVIGTVAYSEGLE